MPNWFYYDESGSRNGPVPTEHLKHLADSGVIQPDTVIESENGQKAYAKNTKGLFTIREPVTKKMEMPLPSPPLPEIPVSVSPLPPQWFYYANDSTKIGPISAKELKFLADAGEIVAGTILESVTGQQTMARNMQGLLNTREAARSTKPTQPPPPIQEKNSTTPEFNFPNNDYTSGLWFYYDVVNNRVGPFEFPTLKEYAKHGIIHPDTTIEFQDGISRMEARYFDGKNRPFPESGVSVWPQEHEAYTADGKSVHFDKFDEENTDNVASSSTSLHSSSTEVMTQQVPATMDTDIMDIFSYIMLGFGWLLLALLPLCVLRILIIDMPFVLIILVSTTILLIVGGVLFHNELKLKAKVTHAVKVLCLTLKPNTMKGRYVVSGFAVVLTFVFGITADIYELGKSPGNKTEPPSPLATTTSSLPSPPPSSDTYPIPSVSMDEDDEDDDNEEDSEYDSPYTPSTRSYSYQSSYSSSMTESRAIEIAKNTVKKGVTYPHRATFLSARVVKSSQNWGVEGTVRACVEDGDYINLPYQVVIDNDGTVILASIYGKYLPASLLK